MGFGRADRTRLSRLISPQNGTLRTSYGHRSFAAPLLMIYRENLENLIGGKIRESVTAFLSSTVGATVKSKTVLYLPLALWSV